MPMYGTGLSVWPVGSAACRPLRDLGSVAAAKARFFVFFRFLERSFELATTFVSSTRKKLRLFHI